MQCALPVGELRIREERQFNNTFLVISPKDNDNGTVRIQRGQTLDLRGTCEGWDETVRLAKCDLGR